MIATRRPLERPKNRSYWIAVLAGGRTSHLLKYRRQLAHYLIDLRYQLSIDHPKAFSRPLPLEADFVLLIKGIITHTQEAALLRRCKERSIRLIKTTDRWATMYRGLWDLGLRQAATPLSLLGDGVQELAEEAAETLCESCAQPLRPASVHRPRPNRRRSRWRHRPPAKPSRCPISSCRRARPIRPRSMKSWSTSAAPACCSAPPASVR